MKRLWYTASFIGFLLAAVLRGSLRLGASTAGFGAGTTPSIVEFPLRCRTDLEVTALAAAITITPGTLVVGTAAGSDSSPPTLFVHSMYGRGRTEVLSGLRDLEARLLRSTRGTRDNLSLEELG